MHTLRWLTSGESHGPELLAILDGIPAGLPLIQADIDAELARRQRGYGRGGRMKIERDEVQIVGGVRGGETLGGPIGLRLVNRDHAKWTEIVRAAPFATLPERLIRPRPGHADLAGGLKYDRRDLRDILERASARETAARVAVGAIAKKLLEALDIIVFSHVVAIGGVRVEASGAPETDWTDLRAAAEASDVRCADPAVAEAMREAIKSASHDGDTVGGTFEVVALNCPPGLGSHVQWDRKLDGRLAQALMSIPAIKAVEIGIGTAVAIHRGSLVHDVITYADGQFGRATNRAGGLEGGMTNGAPLLCSGSMKPISTLRKPLGSVDIDTKKPLEAAFERSDICAVPAAGVVGEAMVAMVVGDAILEKMGGDSMIELRRNHRGYLDQVKAF